MFALCYIALGSEVKMQSYQYIRKSVFSCYVGSETSEEFIKYVRFEVITAVVMNVSIFLDI
jgi:hypothetical protein